jgi:cysteine desulfurase
MGIYLDNHSTTQLAPEAGAAMRPHWERPGNANSPHRAGWDAADAIQNARQKIATLIGAGPDEIVFTSGATEADNLAITGAAHAARSADPRRRRIVVSSIEHKAVLLSADAMRAEGFEVVRIPVSTDGIAEIAVLEQLVSPETCLVSVMAANNEIGTLQPLKEVATIAHHHGALFHVDAAQAAGRIPLDVFALDVDYMSLSAHKMHGPQGVGALFVSSAAPTPTPLIRGGGQQGGVRSGTLPTALIAGFGVAADLATHGQEAHAARVARLADLFVGELLAHQCRFTKMFENGDQLPGSVSVCFSGIDADDLIQMLAERIFLSTGAACNGGNMEPSHVLQAVGLSPEKSREFVRILFSRYNDENDAMAAGATIADACLAVRLATGRSHQ